MPWQNIHIKWDKLF